ncbi:MAG TPA: response regulator [Candidatus Sulfotelmatobacter sp.]|nr:response regulator [Candidatus Sulfotelmatobacter sp.]
MTGPPQNPSLSTLPATRRQRVTAFVVLALIGTVVLALLPWARHPVPAVTPFLPTFATFVALTDLLTAMLLYRDAAHARSISLTVLASGYFYSALIVIGHAATFPGVYAPGGLFGVGPQATVWLWSAWHAGFAAFAIVFAALERSSPRLDARAAQLTRIVAPLGTLALGFGVDVLVVLRSHRLPALLSDSGPHAIVTWHGGWFLLGASAVAMIAQVALPGTRTVAPLWLCVSAGAMVLDVAVSLDGGARDSVGWYLARSISLVSAGVVLSALLAETSRLLTIVTGAESRLRRIVDGVGDALLGLDDQGRILDANPAAIALLGLSEDELRLRSASEVLGASLVPLELSVGENVVIARDVTERRRAEAATLEAIARANEAAEVKSRFLATMSHEIRTPINAVVGMSELMLQTPLTDDARDYAHTVRESAEALLGVINEILDYSKIEAGATELETIAFSPLLAVEGAADILATTARKKQLALATHVASDVPGQVLGDAHRVRQILLNLIGNAVKFTAAGYVTVQATLVRAGDPRRALVRFAVTDTGPGISGDAVESLFEPFRQADAGTTRRFGGTGLGLSISKRLVELMGGEIGVESVPGAGATFWFTVPFERAPDEHPRDAAPALRGARILIVEPEDATRVVAERYLQAWGAHPLGAAGLEQAIALARGAPDGGHDVDAVLLAAPPGADPAEALTRLRRESGSHAPVVLVTTGEEPGRTARALAAGYSAHVRKPLKQSMLHDALAEVLAGVAPVAVPPAREMAAPVEGLVILVADDNAVNRKLTLQQLKKLGYHADAVEDGRAAVDAVLRGRYDLVLMDCEMPELDGLAATRAIRDEEHRRGGHVRIVAMTANALDGDREACLAAGMDDYLAKPVLLDALRGALEGQPT